MAPKQFNVCPLCHKKCPAREILYDHLFDVHKHKLEWTKLFFKTRQDFDKWKTSIEQETNSVFTNAGGFKYQPNFRLQSYHDFFECHRSGCPARIELAANVITNRFNVSYQPIHLGNHTDEPEIVIINETDSQMFTNNSKKKDKDSAVVSSDTEDGDYDFDFSDVVIENVDVEAEMANGHSSDNSNDHSFYARIDNIESLDSDKYKRFQMIKDKLNQFYVQADETDLEHLEIHLDNLIECQRLLSLSNKR